MKPRDFLVALFIAALIIPQQAAAQSFPAPAGDIFRQEGIASWYGPDFDGRPTASGEIFNSALLTAAHPTLPFGTILLVTNRQNNRQVAVKVNDRGPFVASRIIDVSRAAAEQLDMLITGTAPVIIESLSSPVPEFAAQPNPFAYSYSQPAEPVYTPPPVYSQPVPPPVYTPPPVYSQPVPQQPAYSPPPVIIQQIPQPVIQAPPPAPVEAHPPYGPITVTVYPQMPVQPPAAQSPEQQAIEAINMIPPVIDAPPHVFNGAKLVPSIVPQPGKVYKLQVGSYKVASNAVETYVKLQKTGLNPEYERFQDFYRVVVKGIRGEDVHSAAVKVEQAGFSEAIIREE